MTHAADLGLDPPRYQQLAVSIAERIGNGVYRVGSLIPPEERLCREFDVSRFTVRAALRHLQQSGLVSRRQGVGTEVIAAAPSRVFAQTIGSIEELQQYARDTRLVRHRTTRVRADESLASALGCLVGDEFLRIDALRVAAGQRAGDAGSARPPAPSMPIAWTRIHLVEAYAGIRDELPTLSGAIGSRVEELYGERIDAIEQSVSAVDLDESMARRLRVRAGSAGLRIDRRYIGRSGRPFEYVTAIHAAARFALSMRLERTRAV